ncbi:menaquinone biosynthesis family protein [Geoalkalibacter subterraneus]|uniref:1,4-dihydroxy-6-naphtoate synthase n=1 Tax=Geoalkalibacter subterraneus TaxID=483547 RepID=A0A0B5FSW0_9BACT|nr:1,4-dihydroxy-6-naphthoate synthase [Geoalkalibacter subterraneus]AJF07744.1 1,4-dihydroxy-6-naphthoate synthase [Geoalkalibacter subterraneus]
MKILTLGYSPCPNDTFIFHALVHGHVAIPGVQIRERLEDVETLNQLARNAVLDLTKISYHALGHLRENYALLRSGGALGRGCGPLVIAAEPANMDDLRGKRIAIPGLLTTANLLLQLYGEGFDNVVVMRFDQIMPAVCSGEVDAGVIIHESRFTYAKHGLRKILDLGDWWEKTSGLPIPLGGILARRDLGPELIGKLDQAVHDSLVYAYAHPGEARSYIRQHAQELEDEVIDNHIELYVNDFSLNLGCEGEQAVSEILGRAEARGLIPACTLPLFLS